ncbi:hypothetical protein [Streptosporangium sp. NPDC001681]|uniref:hypothetical protein n=1 Tax=Streptosporangium sp. NPDC001681 TaxID=3154395 RepID=UPI00331B01B1
MLRAYAGPQANIGLWKPSVTGDMSRSPSHCVRPAGAAVIDANAWYRLINRDSEK